MESFHILVIFLGAILTSLSIIISVIVLWGKISSALQHLMRGVLDDSGLTKKGKLMDVWPNGSSNLPDFLRVLYQEQGEIKSQQGEIKSEQERIRALVEGPGL